jgi:hypothetical protein
MKIWVENQQEKKKQPEQSHGNRQSQEKNNRNNLLPDRTQPNAASKTAAKAARIASHGKMLNDPTLPPAAREKKK